MAYFLARFGNCKNKQQPPTYAIGDTQTGLFALIDINSSIRERLEKGEPVSLSELAWQSRPNDCPIVERRGIIAE